MTPLPAPKGKTFRGRRGQVWQARCSASGPRALPTRSGVSNAQAWRDIQRRATRRRLRLARQEDGRRGEGGLPIAGRRMRPRDRVDSWGRLDGRERAGLRRHVGRFVADFAGPCVRLFGWQRLPFLYRGVRSVRFNGVSRSTVLHTGWRATLDGEIAKRRASDSPSSEQHQGHNPNAFHQNALTCCHDLFLVGPCERQLSSALSLGA
jgi:hypothetical protein